MKLLWLNLLLCLLSFARLTIGHPQCLDYAAPFASYSISFCSQYKDFGCCLKEKDASLLASYNSIILSLTADNLEQCSGFIKDIMCQECSPYAAHIYDSEATQVIRPFPGLCADYCQTFYTKCSDTVKYISNDTDLIKSLVSMEAFCEFVSINDIDYCYPDLLTNDVLNGQITIDTLTQEGCLCVEEFESNLRNPVIFRSPPDGSGRIFVGEQIGLVHIYYKDKTKLENPFLDLRDVVLSSGRSGDERGLLGLAFHPSHSVNKKLYVYYSTTISGKHYSKLSELLVDDSNLNSVDRSTERVLLKVKQPYSNHNGGEILFGSDGYLYVFLGDGGAGGDPQGYAQNKGSLLGKVLRLDVDSAPDANLAYKIPADNPFVNETGTRHEIYAYGIRNIWRCDVDEGDITTGHGHGRIICGDVGQGKYEEVDVIEKGGNYGWNLREGFQCYNRRTCGGMGSEMLPIDDYSHTVGKSVTGGHVYRGCTNPNLQGQYIFGDYVNGKLFSLEENILTEKWTRKPITMCGDDVCFNLLTNQYHPKILSFGEDDDGEIYILSTSFASPTYKGGKVYKLVDPRRRGDPTKCRSYKEQEVKTTIEVPTTKPPAEAEVTTEKPTTTTEPPTTTTACVNDDNWKTRQMKWKGQICKKPCTCKRLRGKARDKVRERACRRNIRGARDACCRLCKRYKA